MTLDEEMKLWEERSNDEFGQILTKIKKATKDYLYSWEEYGIEQNILSTYIIGYSLDGDRKYTATHVMDILINYDIYNNYKNVKTLVNKLVKLAYK